MPIHIGCGCIYFISLSFVFAVLIQAARHGQSCAIKGVKRNCLRQGMAGPVPKCKKKLLEADQIIIPSLARLKTNVVILRTHQLDFRYALVHSFDNI